MAKIKDGFQFCRDQLTAKFPEQYRDEINTIAPQWVRFMGVSGADTTPLINFGHRGEEQMWSWHGALELAEQMPEELEKFIALYRMGLTNV